MPGALAGRRARDELVVFFGATELDDKTHYYAQVGRPEEDLERAEILMTWHGERIKRS